MGTFLMSFPGDIIKEFQQDESSCIQSWDPLDLPLRTEGASDFRIMGEQELGSFFSIENRPFGLTEVFLH